MQRDVRFVHIDLGSHPEAVFVQPSPGADDIHAAVVAIAIDIDPVIARNGALGHQRQWLFGPRDHRIEPANHVTAGVTDLYCEDRPDRQVGR